MGFFCRVFLPYSYPLYLTTHDKVNRQYYYLLTGDKLAIYTVIMTTNKDDYKLVSDRLYTTKEASVILRISPNTTRRLIREGYLPANRISRPFTIYGAHILNFIQTEFTTAKRQ